MKLSSTVLVILLAIFSFGQTITEGLNSLAPSVPSTGSNPKHDGLAVVYSNTACGLNYVQSSVKTTTRYPSPVGTGFPTTFNISGIPNCATILRAYVWWGGAGTGDNTNFSFNGGPLAVGSIINTGPDICWNLGGSVNYRADVTADITGNGAYTFTIASPPLVANRIDGATLMIIYADPNATYQGTIQINDGLVISTGGPTTHTMIGLNVCANSTYGEAFLVVTDMQDNYVPTHTSILNGTNGTFPNSFYNFDMANTSFTAGQAAFSFGIIPTGPNCYNWMLMGIYYQTTTCAICVPQLGAGATSTPVSCLGVSDGTVTATPGLGVPNWNYVWTNAANVVVSSTNNVNGPNTVTGLPPGVYTVSITGTNGCMETLSVTVTAPPCPAISFTAPPAATIVQCAGDIPAMTNLAWDSGCLGSGNVAGIDGALTGGTCGGTITRTWTHTNSCGNSIVATQIFTVNDVTDPAASDLASISVPGFMDVPVPNIALVNDETDNCTVNPVVAWVSDVSDGNVCNLEEITRTYSVTDDCGNQIFVTQLIVILALAAPAPIDEEDKLICFGDQVTLVADNPWGVPISWDNGVIDSQPFTPSQTTTYTVTADNLGCMSTATATVVVEELPTVLFIASEPGCEPFTVTFTNQSVAGAPNGVTVNCVWNVEGSAPINQCGNLTYTFPVAGVYDVGLTITSVNGCVNSVMYPDLINVIAMPIASFEASSTSLSIDTEVDFTNTSENAIYYDWDFGDTTSGSTEENPTHVFPYQEDDIFLVTLVAYNEVGCTDTARLVIAVTEQLIFYIPNTFTPNNDAFNNTFQPVFTSGYEHLGFDMYIFNRWGELIFESHGEPTGWNGMYRGKVIANDTYTWKIEFTQKKEDKRHIIVGHVNVIR